MNNALLDSNEYCSHKNCHKLVEDTKITLGRVRRPRLLEKMAGTSRQFECIFYRIRNIHFVSATTEQVKLAIETILIGTIRNLDIFSFETVARNWSF